MPDDPINGHKNCSDGATVPLYCTLYCDDGYAFAYQDLEDYYCPSMGEVFLPRLKENGHDPIFDLDDIEVILAGTLDKNTNKTSENQRKKRSLAMPIHDPPKWLPETNPSPFPDCSVATHTTMAVASASMDFEIPTSADSFCDDPLFLGQVGISESIIISAND